MKTAQLVSLAVLFAFKFAEQTFVRLQSIIHKNSPLFSNATGLVG
jgi:hypothetical protein